MVNNAAVVEEAVSFLRKRICGMAWSKPGVPVLPLLPDTDEISRDLEAFLTETIENGHNNSVLLLGPRGCGKTMVSERVLLRLQRLFPDRTSVVRLNGLLHADDRYALKEIAEQLCMEHHLQFSKTATFDDNMHFLTTMLKESALSHKSVIFILEEFDLFAQEALNSGTYTRQVDVLKYRTSGGPDSCSLRPKQRLLYSILNAMQSTLTQAAVVGLCCRLDAVELLEKRVKSRFSNRKLLFLPPPAENLFQLLRDVLLLPVRGSNCDSTFLLEWNENTSKVLEESMQDFMSHFIASDLSPHHILDLALRALCNIDKKGLLTVADFKVARMSLHRQLMKEGLRNLSVLELYLLVCMKRLESKEQEIYNFSGVFKEYNHLQDSSKTSDRYSREIALRAFEHLLEKELVVFADGRGQGEALEFRPVQLLLDNNELQEGLDNNPVCPVTLRQWFEHTFFK